MPGLGLRTLFGPRSRRTEPTPDQELLARFLGDRDEDAFAALMDRHVAMVLQVCRRILRNAHDAEDACQAVFLVLARRAHSIRNQGSVASWLHGVAWNVAHKLHTSHARRNAREEIAATQKTIASEPDDMSWREVQRLVDEELNRMPSVYKDALVLCYLEGRTQEAAAQELGWSLGTLRGRLERGREMLRGRLTRRGVTGAATLAIAVLLPSVSAAAMPTGLIAATASASVPVAAGAPMPASVSASVAGMTREALRTALWTKWTISGAMALSALLLGFVLTLLAHSEATAIPGPKPVQAIVHTWSEASRLEVPNCRVWCVAFSKDGQRLAAGARGPINDSGELRVWDVDTHKLLFALETPRSVRCVAFAPDGKTLATAEHDGIARLRDSADGKVLFTLGGHKGQIDTVAYSPDGKIAATSCWDGAVRLWNTATGEQIRALPGHLGQVFVVNFGGNNDILASGGADNLAKLWKPSTGETLFTLRGHQDVVHWIAFSPPDGHTLATASWDKSVKLWDTRTGKLSATLLGHTEPVLAVAFAPDGKALISSAGSRLVPDSPAELILWDLAAQKARNRFSLPDRVFGVAFSPDGKTLAAGCWDGAVRLCSAQTATVPTDVADPPVKLDELQFVHAQPGDLQAPALKKTYAEDYHPNLKDSKKTIDGLTIFGPDAAACVKFDPAGMSIALPIGYPRSRPGTGVVTDFGITGDFEITAAFEIMQEPNTGMADLKLVIVPSERADADVWHKANQNRASLSREWIPPNKFGQYAVDVTKWNPALPRDKWNNEIFTNIETHSRQRFPTTARAGRLRLVRNGTTLYFFTSDGPDPEFTLRHKDEFAAKALKNVRVLASSAGGNASIDVRVTDLQIRADGFTKQADLTIPLPAIAATDPPRRGWLLLGLIALPGMILILALAGGAFFLLRRRGTPSAAAPDQDETHRDTVKPAASSTISFKCPNCGKLLRAKIDKAGGKLKCPKCVKPVTVPNPKEMP